MENEKKLTKFQIHKIIDSLLEIKIYLETQRLSRNKISKISLKQAIDNSKKDNKDEAVSIEIDNVFEEYFKKEEKKQDRSLSFKDIQQKNKQKVLKM